ncbi:MAG: hypothetical protein ACXWMI_06720 [Syntrophales bacterium]
MIRNLLRVEDLRCKVRERETKADRPFFHLPAAFFGSGCVEKFIVDE